MMLEAVLFSICILGVILGIALYNIQDPHRELKRKALKRPGVKKAYNTIKAKEKTRKKKKK